MVGQQRQDDQRRGGEDQQVVHLAVGQHRAHEAMQGDPRVQQHGDHHADAGREARLPDGQPAQQGGGDQRRLRREAGVAVTRMPVGKAGEGRHAQHRRS
jgi:hypothetical protein